MFAGGRDTSTVINELVAGVGWIDATRINLYFCSLMHSEEDYRALVIAVGLEMAATVLRRLGDAVVLNLEGGDPNQLALIESDAFFLSMLRQDRSWTALRRGSRHFRYVPLVETSDAANSFSMVVDLPSADNRYRVDFDFTKDRLIRDRFAVLIGRNGAGKSQLLLSIIEGLANSNIHLVPRRQKVRFKHDDEGTQKFGAPKFSRIVAFTSTPSDAYPSQIDPWLGIDYQYFSMTQRAQSHFDSLTISLIDCLRDDFRSTFPNIGVSISPSTTTGGRIALLGHILGPLGLWDSLYLPLKTNSESRPYTDFTWNERGYVKVGRRYGEQANLRFYRQIDLTAAPVIFDRSRFEPRHLSSGETAMFRFAAQATAAAENGTLFLFDEPETHLHPHYVSEFVEILHLLLTATKSVAIAATHSAYLVREAPSQRVRVLSVDDRIVSISRPRLQTFGASIDSISKAVFADLEISHQYQTTLQRWVDTLPVDIQIEAVIAEFGEDMNSETLSLVRRLLNTRQRGVGA
ncbi:AAA family ATPase [Agrobacterium tumefaciens]|uniref:ATPase AAA-type core domain-containing protein n=1 Tax=Agrobacterium tumefaciens TaxID=358 RepID=A0AB36EIL4_AGRTU|nr:hypothetical protein A6U91_20940 [Agrobacterium tumefaciens]